MRVFRLRKTTKKWRLVYLHPIVLLLSPWTRKEQRSLSPNRSSHRPIPASKKNLSLPPTPASHKTTQMMLRWRLSSRVRIPAVSFRSRWTMTTLPSHSKNNLIRMKWRKCHRWPTYCTIVYSREIRHPSLRPSTTVLGSCRRLRAIFLSHFSRPWYRSRCR